MARFPGRWPAALVLYAVFATAMVFPLLFLGKIYYFRDFGRYYRPVKQYCLPRLAAGELPVWLPAMNCGTPVHGELVHGLLYPGNVLLYAGETTGWGLYFAAHLLLAAVSARALARRLGAEEIGALAAGFAFAGSGYVVSQMNHVPYLSAAAWSPLILWMGLAGRGVPVPWLALAFGAAALAGEPFTILLTVLFLAVLVLAGLSGPRLPALLRIGAAGLIGALIASPALLPALEQIGESVRAGGLPVDEEGFGSLQPFRLGTLLSPEGLGRLQQTFHRRYDTLFGSVSFIVPILLALHLGALTTIAAALAPVRRSRTARVLCIAAGAFLLLSLGSYLGLATVLTRVVPGLSAFRYPDKYWFVVTLAAALLVAIALPGLRPRPVLVAASSLGIAGLAYALLFGEVAGGVLGLLAFGLVAGAFRLPAPLRGRVLLLLLAAELLFFGLRHHGVTDPAALSPMNAIGEKLMEHRPGRIFVDFKFPPRDFEMDIRNQTEILAGDLESMVGVPYGFQYTQGYDPIEPLARIGQFFALPEKLTSEKRTLLFHRLLRLTANTHSITNVDLSGDVNVERAVWGGPRQVVAYAYREPGPRARLFGAVKWVRDFEAGREHLQDLEFDPFRVLLLEGEGADADAGPPRGTVLWEEDGDREIRLRVFSDRPAWLFLADAYAAAWRAWVDGEPARIEIADIAFRAVRVPAGECEVRFRYEPEWLGVAPFTAGVGLLALVGAFLRRRRGSPDQRSGPRK